MAIAAPERIECVPMSETLNPNALSPMTEAAALNRETALVGKEREVQMIFEHVGFSTALHREKISRESFLDYTDLTQAKEKDILKVSLQT